MSMPSPATDGIDGLFVGPFDLSIALSNGAVLDPYSKDVDAALDVILAAANKHKKIPGIFCANAEARACRRQARLPVHRGRRRSRLSARRRGRAAQGAQYRVQIQPRENRRFRRFEPLVSLFAGTCPASVSRTTSDIPLHIRGFHFDDAIVALGQPGVARGRAPWPHPRFRPRAQDRSRYAAETRRNRRHDGRPASGA